MPDTKITALTAIGANPIIPATFPIPMVDLTDTSMAASGTTKKVTVNQILGSGGTATLASATISGDLTVDTSTLKVNSANNRVGIGTATPADTLDIYSPLGTAAIKLQTGANIAFSLNSQIPGVANNGFSIYDVTAAANRLTIDSSGNVNAVGGNLIIGTSGKGIDFSATANGSGTMTSELLNDYEEGTWTATLKGSVSDPTTPVTATGRYTKIGRQVSIQLFVNNVTTTGASGRIQIDGLPFANNGTVEAISSVGFYNMATFTGVPFGLTTSSGTSVDMWSSVSAGVFQAVNYNPGTVQYVWVNLTYTI